MYWHVRIIVLNCKKTIRLNSSALQTSDSAKQPVQIIQPKPQSQIFVNHYHLVGEQDDSVPCVSNLIFRKCQKLRLSSIGFLNQSEILGYINHISKNELSVCLLLPVEVNWLKKCCIYFFALDVWSFEMPNKSNWGRVFFTWNTSVSKTASVFSRQPKSKLTGFQLTRTTWIRAECFVEPGLRRNKVQNCGIYKHFELSSCSHTNFRQKTSLIFTAKLKYDKFW